MNLTRLKIPTIVLAVVALIVGVSSGAMAAKLITSKDIKDGTIVTKDLKQNGINGNRLSKGSVNGAKLQGGTVAGAKLKPGSVGNGKIADGAVTSNKIANGSVTADKLAPGAVAFPQTLWGPMIRNQQGAGQSTLVTGPGTPPMGTGSLQLTTTGDADLAAFGDSVDFAGESLASITSLSYSSWTESPPFIRPSLRMEINPHLVPDATPGGVFEFTTLVFVPPPTGAGWVTHSNIQADAHWFLTGAEGTQTGCTGQTPCTLAAVIAALNGNDGDPTPPAITTGVYFAYGAANGAAVTSVDKFVYNNNSTFDFEPNGVFLTTS